MAGVTIEGLFYWQVIYCRQAWFYFQSPVILPVMTIAIDILLKSKCHYVVELAVGLTRFFSVRDWSANAHKRGNVFSSKKTDYLCWSQDLLSLWLAQVTDKYDVFTAFGLMCLLLLILCAKHLPLQRTQIQADPIACHIYIQPFSVFLTNSLALCR